MKLIEKLFPFDELIETVKRFPLSVFCALALFVLTVLNIHEIIDFDQEENMARIYASLSCFFFWFGAAQLISERSGASFSRHALTAIIGAGILAAFIWLPSLWGMHLMFVVPVLFLTLMIAGYMNRGDDQSFWFFNMKVLLGAAVSYLALLMFAGGLSVALWAIELLFDLDINNDIYGDIWAFAGFVLGPIYALSWVPKIFDFNEDDCTAPTGLHFIANWISVPMVFVYLLILYAYFIKIITTGEVPNGQLAYMITGFAGAGIITYMVAWPMRDKGSAQLKLFYKIFFPALLIPVGFHFYAIWERVSAYGITEQRYIVMLSAMWFAILAISNTFTRVPLKTFPMTLVVLFAFASFGPWGGVSLSGHSQNARLLSLLESNNLLVDGKIKKVENGLDIPLEDRRSISSILDYLCRTERDAKLEPLFRDNYNTGKWSCYSANLTKKLGFEYISSYRSYLNKERFYHSLNHGSYIDLSDDYEGLVKNASVYFNSKSYLRLDHDDTNGNHEKNREKARNKSSYNVGEDKTLQFDLSDENVLSIYLNDNNLATIDISDIVAASVRKEKEVSVFTIEGEENELHYKLFFTNISGEIREKTHRITNANFDFLFRLPE